MKNNPRFSSPIRSFSLRLRPFRKLSAFLYDRFVPRGKRLKLTDELDAVSCHQKDSTRTYYLEKISSTLFISSLMGAALLFGALYSARQNRGIPSNLITRPGYGKAALEETLNLTAAGEKESESVTIRVSPKAYTYKQAQDLLDQAETQLQKQLPGRNDSLDDVRYPLQLPQSLLDDAISAEYTISPYGVIDDTSGVIVGDLTENGTPVTVEATLKVQGLERICRYAAVIFPPALTDKEQFSADLDTALRAADNSDPTSDQIRLPAYAGDTPLSWSRPKGPFLTILFILTLLLPTLFWFQKDEKMKELAKKRRELLDLDYSELLFKLTLLIGAGLTIKGAFSRICSQQETLQNSSSLPARGGKDSMQHPTERNKLPSGKGSRPESAHPVYGEIQILLREITDGVPEETAYENFGRRCGLPTYIKLGSLLAQNLRKGSSGLTALLEKEAFLSLQQHRTAARKMGERASMRMLFPMLLMFVDVMLIMMVPAMLSF
jgi:tight adherence protein C